jgi:hypothetical protein
MDLVCAFGEVEYRDKRYYSCEIEVANIIEEGTRIHSIVGEHRKDETNQDVEAVWFHDTTVKFFPRDLIKIFPNLKALAIQNCGLKSISREDLEGLEKLEILEIYDNKLRSLPTNLFSGMTKLFAIDFISNKLKYLSSKMFLPILGSLEFVDLCYNTKINMNFDQKKGSGSMRELMDEIDRNCKDPKKMSDNSSPSKLFRTWQKCGKRAASQTSRSSAATLNLQRSSKSTQLSSALKVRSSLQRSHAR